MLRPGQFRSHGGVTRYVLVPGCQWAATNAPFNVNELGFWPRMRMVRVVRRVMSAMLSSCFPAAPAAAVAPAMVSAEVRVRKTR